MGVQQSREGITMIVKLGSKLVGGGLYTKRLCSQAQQLRTTVIGKRQRKEVLVLTRQHKGLIYG